MKKYLYWPSFGWDVALNGVGDKLVVEGELKGIAIPVDALSKLTSK